MAIKKPDAIQNALGTIARIVVPGEAEAQERDKEIQARRECISSGGVWDATTKTCRARTTTKPADTKTAEKPKGEIPKGSIETFTDSKTNLPSGAVLPDGRTFLGLSPSEVQKIADGEARKTALPQNAMPVGTAQATAEQQQRVQQLTQMAQQGLITADELQAIQGSQLNLGQAAGAGAVSALPGVIGGAVAGAATGAAIGNIPGAVVGAVAGGVGSFLLGVRSDIKSQQVGEFSADQSALSKGQTMLNNLIADTNMNPQNAPENIELFYKTLNMIDAAHMKTFKDSQEDLNKFLGNDGTEQLAKFEVFDSTMRQYYVNRFETALMSPNPQQAMIDLQFLMNEEEGEI